MPVYQYACTECGEELEARQSFSDDSLTVCPACNGRLRKVLTAVGVVFKGSGFYRNDSRAAAGNDSGATSTAGEKSNGEASKPAAAKGDSTSGDAKPAAPAPGAGKKNDGAGKGAVAGSKPAAAAAR